jgi:hypothetical protein
MSNTQSNNVKQPSSSEVDSWWRFALKFKRGTNSPFKNGIGAQFESVSNPHQPGNLYCLTCTAGNGGNDAQPRKINRNTIGGKDVFVPVFVSIGKTPNDADGDLGGSGSQTLIFELEDNSGQVQHPNTFKVDSQVNVNVSPDNEFDLPAGSQTVHTRNICAIIPSNEIGNIKKITFGGKGGRINPQSSTPFNTKVIFEIT